MRRHDEKLQRLSEVTLFRRCDRKELKHLAGVADEVSLPAGAVLCQEGTLARECFVLVTGEGTGKGVDLEKLAAVKRAVAPTRCPPPFSAATRPAGMCAYRPAPLRRGRGGEPFRP